MQTHLHTSMHLPTAAPLMSEPPPWALFSWPTVFCQANRRRKPNWLHLTTRVTHIGSTGQPPSGQTVWTDTVRGKRVGIAWDWSEVCDGVLALVDPMCLVTNLRLLNAEGEVMTAMQAAPYLNRWVHDLPWQDEVWKVLRSA